MLKRLYLRNFKLFKEQEFIFNEGITTIVGPNGSGKTTILEAIEFALFKQVSRKEKTVKTHSELVRHTSDKCRIELEFVAPINKKTHRVVREILPNRSVDELFVENREVPIEKSSKKVTTKITKLLGMDRHAFSALIYVRQGEIDNLSRLAPKTRREELYNMMGLGIYNKAQKKTNSRMRELQKQIEQIHESREKINAIKKHLPTREQLQKALDQLVELERRTDKASVTEIRTIVDKLLESIEEIEKQMSSPELKKNLETAESRRGIAKRIKAILETIPGIAEEQLRPYIREEARAIFKGIFGDKYSDLQIDDNYEVSLYNLQGVKVPLIAASGGEDVCVNFALRVAVNTALQKCSLSGEPPRLLILDEPGVGLDFKRKQWLPQALAGIESVNQVIIVTHMDELREAADHVISLTPRGPGRQPLVQVE